MSHEFTDGVMMQGEKAWHDLGQVVDGTLPAREAFTRANALFTVEKAPLIFRNPVTGVESASEHRCATYRTDTGDQLGTVSLGYEVIQNEELCKFAEMLRDDCEMETVVVLKGGAKIAFSAKILGTDAEVVKGDVIHRRLNGYLSHDGTTSFGGMFSNVRIVCSNTLGWAMQDANKHGKQFKISHTKLGVSQIDSTLRSIDIARQTFNQEVEDYKRMAETQMDFDSYRTWLTDLYNMPSVKMDDGTLRPGQIEDSKVKWNKLRNAWAGGYGTSIDGVSDTVWGAFNAVTEVETSLRDAPESRNIATVNGYYVQQIVNKARRSAAELCTV
jgi:phage/plasmid-like protein (TIGR03299 family)|tara:strand:- start:572 stop:1558 length:987 start_codon:yes stop_codon:yes gene_type:complete